MTDDEALMRVAVKLDLFAPELIEDWEWCRTRPEYADVCAGYRRAVVKNLLAILEEPDAT